MQQLVGGETFLESLKREAHLAASRGASKARQEKENRQRFELAIALN
jgi:hypothetical protein